MNHSFGFICQPLIMIHGEKKSSHADYEKIVASTRKIEKIVPLTKKVERVHLTIFHSKCDYFFSLRVVPLT